MNRYYIEIDTNGEYASGYEDCYNWCNYGTISAEGNTLDELLESATVDLMDQDGGELAVVEADKDWMQNAVRAEYMRQCSFMYKLHQVYISVTKPLRPLSYYDTYMGKKPNILQKALSIFKAYR